MVDRTYHHTPLRLFQPPLHHHKKEPWPPKAPTSLLRRAATASTMPRTTNFLLVILLILFLETSLGQAEITEDETEPPNPAYLSSKMKTRRALVEVMLDYDYGVHNSRHEPRRGKPGIGSKNP